MDPAVYRVPRRQGRADWKIASGTHAPHCLAASVGHGGSGGHSVSDVAGPRQQRGRVHPEPGVERDSVSLQTSAEVDNHKFNDKKNTTYNSNNFYHPYSHDLLGLINSGSLSDFFDFNNSNQINSNWYDFFGYYDVAVSDPTQQNFSFQKSFLCILVY